MENILKRDPSPDHGDFEELRYDLNSSEYENMDIEEDHRNSSNISETENRGNKVESNLDNHLDDINVLSIKKENENDYSSEIIFPQASQSQSTSIPKIKKEIKSKKELEEEEREKMQ